MILPNTEKRACPRFGVPGALIEYGKLKAFGRQSAALEKGCPVVDLSRGGTRFLTRESPSLGSKLFIEITLPGEDKRLLFHGTVCWMAEHSGDKFHYSVGIQFHPYGQGKRFNAPENLNKLGYLENKFLNAPPEP